MDNQVRPEIYLVLRERCIDKSRFTEVYFSEDGVTHHLVTLPGWLETTNTEEVAQADTYVKLVG